MAKFAYKLFKTHDGKLFPLYVNAQQETPIGTWLQAIAGQIKVVRTLTPEEVRTTCQAAGIEPQAMEE